MGKPRRLQANWWAFGGILLALAPGVLLCCLILEVMEREILDQDLLVRLSLAESNQDPDRQRQAQEWLNRSVEETWPRFVEWLELTPSDSLAVVEVLAKISPIPLPVGSRGSHPTAAHGIRGLYFLTEALPWAAYEALEGQIRIHGEDSKIYLEALAGMGPRGTALIQTLWDQGEVPLRNSILEVVSRRVEEPAPEGWTRIFRSGLAGRDSGARFAALRGFFRNANAEPEDMDRLLSLLRSDESALVRRYAAHALGAQPWTGELEWMALESLPKDKDAQVNKAVTGAKERIRGRWKAQNSESTDSMPELKIEQMPCE